MIKRTFFLFYIFILLIGIIPSAELIKEISTATLENVGSLISNELANEDVSVASATITKEGSNNRISFFGESPSAKIKDDLFENIDTSELAYLELNDLGEVVSADLTASKDTVFSFGGTPYAINKGERAYYKDGKLISYGKSVGIKEKDSDKFTTLNCLGDSLEFEKDAEGNSVVVGDLKIGNDEAKGKVTLSNEKISEIWEGTDATINGINNKVSGNNLKVTYNKDFDLLDCQGNCINYETDKISLKGSGFTTNIGKKNEVFEGLQAVDLKTTMEYGTLEISRDKSKSELVFNVESTGNFKLENGRTVFVSSQEYIKQDGIMVSSDCNKLFVKTDFSQGFSHDMTLNGDFVLSDNLIQNDKGELTYKGILPWENVAYKRQNLVTTKEEIAEIEKQTGKGTFAADWSFALKDEQFNRELFKNSEKVDIPPEVLAMTVLGEGWVYRASSGSKSFWDKYKENPNQNFYPGEVSLLKLPNFIDELKKRELISPDVSIIYSSLGTKFIKGEDVFNLVAATTKYCEELIVEDIGEAEYNKMTNNKKFCLMTYIYNTLGTISTAGRTAVIQKRDEICGPPVNAKDYVANYENTGEYSSAQMNAKIREAEFLGLVKYFEYP